MSDPVDPRESLRLTIDDDIFIRQQRGGVSRYFVELLREFGTDPTLGVEVDAPRFWSRNQHLIEAGLGRRMPTPIGRKTRAQALANRVMRARGRKPDVLHHTFYSRSYLDAFPQPRVRVVTIYDMIPEALPEMFPNGNPHFDKREFVEAADVIVCISESTRADLERFYGPQRAPTAVVPLAVGSEYSPSAGGLGTLPDRYLLYVGARVPYKDFGTLVEAFGAVAGALPDVHLVAIGSHDYSPAELDLFRALRVSDRVHHFSLSDEEMPSAYAHALGYVSPSRYEGFGLPTLEAMASGCPAVLAATSSHPEVGGDAALYFEAGDVDALSGIVRDLCTDADRREHQRSLGIRRASAFTWRKTAQLTAQAYRLADRAT